MDIKQPKTSWEDKYFSYVAKLPEFQHSPKGIFYLNGRNDRLATRNNAMIATANTGIGRENAPTVDELLHNHEKRDEYASKAMSLKSNIKDSDAYWYKNRSLAMSSFRYLEDIPS